MPTDPPTSKTTLRARQPVPTAPAPAGRAASRDDGGRGIQSMEVGGRLLIALTRHGTPMQLRDLAQDAGMAPASAHPYLVSFRKLGLVEQDAATGRYFLGPLALQMGLASLHQRDAVRLAVPEAAELAGDTGLSVAVSIWGNLGATVVRLEPSRRPIHVSLRTGSVMSTYNTATGRLFGAYLPAAALAHLPELDAHVVGGEVGRPPADAIARVFGEVRAHGMARTIGVPTPGVNALSAPVFDHDGSLALSVTVLGAAGDFDADLDGPVAARLRARAESLSRRLGWGGETEAGRSPPRVAY